MEVTEYWGWFGVRSMAFVRQYRILQGRQYAHKYLSLILLDCIHEELVFSSWYLFSLYTHFVYLWVRVRVDPKPGSKVSLNIIKKYHSSMISSVIFYTYHVD